MSNKFKEINIKSGTYYFLDDVINEKILLQIKSKLVKSQK